MREIKFRGKRVSYKSWYYGSVITCDDGKAVIVNSARHTWAHSYVEVIPKTIGQFTGWHDSNGNEIYEGDIIDVHIPCNAIGEEEHRTRIVAWNSKMSCFQFQDKNGNCISDSVGAKYNVIHYSVIGNIHDNEELLQHDES